MSTNRGKKPEAREDDRKAMGDRLREAREYLGFSQEEVATYLGVPRSALSLIEAGTRKVDALELKKLAGLYKRPVAYFTGEEGKGSDVVIELTSSSTRDEDVKDESVLYERTLRVSEYFLFDPLGDYLDPPLHGAPPA